MAKKGKAKNTVNKAKHTKLFNRKKAKLKKEKETRKERLKTIAKMKHTQNETL
ncbi:hypothetical protein [uncultured Kriegella sp.]|uniref:hypothetical protein n=1 Tax=uncultured Kriegella sp. TaxID=1798910 RepID=UPI0030DD9026|tara:strand:- start:9008 stop:9166 length:159 start_codon:yes stop_codon:yes gene_type:complete